MTNYCESNRFDIATSCAWNENPGQNSANPEESANPDAADPIRGDGDFWVFGYGSLMWRPDFPYLERVPAYLVGMHRVMCVYSVIHRGTPDRPGLVLGLDRGGSCRGIAYRVAAARREATLAYLREREQTTRAYDEVVRRVTLHSSPRRSAAALVYAANRSHPLYAGNLDTERQLSVIRQGHGRSGSSLDYVLSAVAEIEAQGCGDRKLRTLAQRIKEGANLAM